MADIVLEWFDYRYFPYERDLALREVKSLLEPEAIQEGPEGLHVYNAKRIENVSRLVYFARASWGNTSTYTQQELLERSCPISGSKRRQATRYSVHGMHEYRGKFNPQLSRAVQNIIGLEVGKKVLDPFCGSGTTLVEGAYSGHPTIGMDMNPLAIEISNAKLNALRASPSALQTNWQALKDKKEDYRGPSLPQDDRATYLSKWFDSEVLQELESYRAALSATPKPFARLFSILISDLLRDYSLQEPADLRIRRRNSPMPELPFAEAIDQRVLSFLTALDAAQAVAQPEAHCEAHLWDNSAPNPPFAAHHSFDAAITSPPYSTALPYIDTQRLSLIWLGLTDPKDLRQLEGGVTGSRELLKSELALWNERLKSNLDQLPAANYEFCLALFNSLTDMDGFRRQAVPALTYRYLLNMQDMFRSVNFLLKPNSPFALVVGHNKTTLSGQRFDIDTPKLLVEIAKALGYDHQESIPLQTYQRYDIHSGNSVNSETLLILRSPG